MTHSRCHNLRLKLNEWTLLSRSWSATAADDKNKFSPTIAGSLHFIYAIGAWMHLCTPTSCVGQIQASSLCAAICLRSTPNSMGIWKAIRGNSWCGRLRLAESCALWHVVNNIWTACRMRIAHMKKYLQKCTLDLTAKIDARVGEPLHLGIPNIKWKNADAINIVQQNIDCSYFACTAAHCQICRSLRGISLFCTHSVGDCSFDSILRWTNKVSFASF